MSELPVRIVLDAAASVVVADDGTTVRGVAVPWGVVGHTSAGPVRFARGALPTDLDDPLPLLLDHDTTRPIGVVAELVDDPDALRFVAALDPVPDAEHARAGMRSGSRRGVSVGVDVVTATPGPDGVLDVVEAAWAELSSVVRPAFRGARVAAARRPAPAPDPDPDPAQREDPAMPDPTPAVVDEPATVPAAIAPNVSVAPTLRGMARDVVAQLRAADGALDGRALRAVVEQVDAAAVRAALWDVTTADWPPVGTWVRELDNVVRRGMPVVTAFDVRPTSAWPVFQAQMKTAPVPAKQTAEKNAIATTPVAIEFAEQAGATYAHGNDLSVQLVEDYGEQVIEQYVELVAEYIGRLIDKDAAAALVAAAAAGPTGAVDLTKIGTAIGTVAGSGRPADRLVCAPDVYGKVWALVQQNGPALTGLYGADERLRVVPSKDLAAGTAVVGSSEAFRTYLSPSARLRAVDVSLLGIDLGVYQRAAFRVVDAAALVKLTTT